MRAVVPVRERWIGAAIFAAALTARWHGADSETYEANADESQLVWDAMSLTTGDLNPHNFIYPSLVKYVFLAVVRLAAWTGVASGQFPAAAPRAVFFVDPAWFITACRHSSALAGAATTWLLFIGARRQWGMRAALFAAAALLFAPVHIRYSGLATTDAFLTLWCAAATLAALRVADGGTRMDSWVCGIFAGLAASSKYTGAAMAGLLVVAHLLRRKSARWGQDLAIGAVVCAATALATSPFVWLDFTQFKSDLFVLSGLVQTYPFPDHAGPDLLFYPEQLFRNGLGAGWALIACGALAATVRWGDAAARLAAGTGAGFILYMSMWRMEAARYILPAYPGFCLAAGWGLSRLADRWPLVAWPAATAATVISIATAATFTWWVAPGGTRTEMRRFIETQVPSGSFILKGGADDTCFLPSAEFLRAALAVPQAAGPETRTLINARWLRGPLFHVASPSFHPERYDLSVYAAHLPDYVVFCPWPKSPGLFVPTPDSAPGRFAAQLAENGNRIKVVAPSWLHPGPRLELWRLRKKSESDHRS